MCKTATATLGTAAHTWQMTAHGNTEIAHKAMLNAGEAMALAALKTMESPEILKKAHDEWMAETNGITSARPEGGWAEGWRINF